MVLSAVMAGWAMMDIVGRWQSKYWRDLPQAVGWHLTLGAQLVIMLARLVFAALAFAVREVMRLARQLLWLLTCGSSSR